MRLNFTAIGSQYGEGVPLVILHALFASGRTWHSLAKRLSRENQRRVILLDLRNHGASGHGSRMNYDIMAADVLSFLNEHGLADAVLLGHSMGGKVAMTLALRHAERCTGLIVIDIAPIRYAADYREIFAGFKAVLAAGVTNRRQASDIIAPFIPEQTTRQFILTNLIQRDGRLVWRLNISAIEHAMPELADFSMPEKGQPYGGEALFVRGAQSVYIQETGAKAIARVFPNAKIKTIAAAGHWINAEAPAAMATEIHHFLRRLAAL